MRPLIAPAVVTATVAVVHHSYALIRTYVSSESSSSGNRTPRSGAWSRGARRVKETTTTTIDSVEHLSYVKRIRETHDPSLHLKTLEDELKSTIGQALRKQADKITFATARMDQELTAYVRLLQHARQRIQTNDVHHNINHNRMERLVDPVWTQLQEISIRYNQYRSQALQARWELIVHRQAAGFLVNNHNVVTRTFPIDKALPTDLHDIMIMDDHHLLSGTVVSQPER